VRDKKQPLDGMLWEAPVQVKKWHVAAGCREVVYIRTLAINYVKHIYRIDNIVYMNIFHGESCY